MSAPRQTWTIIVAAMAIGVVSPAALADEIGHEELIARLGAAAPTGAGVRVVQCEASEQAGALKVLPDGALAAFAGKTFNQAVSGMTVSWHGTEVARSFYGIGTSIAPGITQVHVYDANGFLQSNYLQLGAGFGVAPSVPPGPSSLDRARVFNHSWIGAINQGVFDSEALRRADFAMHRDNTLFVVGENNGAGSTMQPLLACGYNSIAVGRIDGQHSAGNTPASVDGAGRMKPELVAPGQFTSFSTPVVSAAAALLYQTAATAPYNQNVNRARGVAIKAALLAGATHGPSWTNNAPTSGAGRGITARPLDPVFGCGTVNIDRAHRIITADESQSLATADDAALEPPAPQVVLWDVEVLQSSAAVQQFHYRLDLPAPGDVSIVATWTRNLPTNGFSSATAPAIANVTLRLQRIEGDMVVPLTGDAGIDRFESGNVVSSSAVDNVEHLFVRGLAPGSYVVSVVREATAASALSFLAVAGIVDLRTVPGDLNGDGVVNGDDLGIMLGAWGPGTGPADLNLDDTVDGNDLGILLGAWT